MAGAAIKGIATVANTLGATRQLGASMSVVPDIQKKKSTALGGLSLFYGFVPINPVIWGLQMPLLLILTLICAFYFEFSWKGSFLIAYVIQGFVVAYFYNTVTSALSSIMFGI